MLRPSCLTKVCEPSAAGPFEQALVAFQECHLFSALPRLLKVVLEILLLASLLSLGGVGRVDLAGFS